MKATRTIAVWCLLAGSTMWGSVAWGQGYPVTSSAVVGTMPSVSGQAVVPDTVGYTAGQTFGPWVGFYTQLDDGLGYTGNLYTVDSLIPMHLDDGTNMLFAVINGSATEQGQGVGNFGVGYRHYSQEYHRVFGLSMFADIDNGHRDHYQRWGVSLESLGKYIDMRLNTYFMMGSGVSLLSQNISDVGYMGNNIILTQQLLTEHAYSGGDIEVGGPLPFAGRYGLNFYVGGYYLQANGDVDSATGWKMRGELLVTEDVTVGANFYDDRVFGTNAYATLSLTIPNGKEPRFLRPRRVRERMQDRVVREMRIATKTQESFRKEAAINPADNQPYYLLHVNPDAGVPGIGTFESPFQTMEQLRNGNIPGADILLVSARDDATGTNLSAMGPLVLFDNQRLLSDAIPHSVVATQGTFQLPVLSSSMPIISNSLNGPMSGVVQLANNNEVSGFIIDGGNVMEGASFGGTPHGRGIFSTGPTNGFNINRNTFQGYTDGVSIVGASGRGILTSNTFSGLTNVSNNGSLIVADQAGTMLDLLMQNNLAVNNGATTSGVGLSVTAENGATVNANDPDGAVPTGIIGNIAANTADDDPADGIDETAGNGTGIALTTNTGGVINAVLDQNIVANNTNIDGAGIAVTANTGTINLDRVANTEATGNQGAGIWFHANGGAVNVTTFTANNASANFGSGVRASADNAGVLTMAIGSTGTPDAPIGFPDNMLTGNGLTAGDGLRIETAGDGVVRGSIVNNDISGQQNNGAGIGIRVNPSGTVDFGDVAMGRVIQGNNLDGNDGAGLLINSVVTPTTTASISATLRTNNILNNNGGGVVTRQNGLNHNLPQPPLSPFPTGGPENNLLTLEIGGPTPTEDQNGNGSLDPGEDLNGNGLLDQNDTNMILNNAVAGVSVSTLGNSRAVVNIENNFITGTTATDTDPDGDLVLTDGDGAFLSRADASLLQATITNNVLTNNASDGVHVSVIGSSSASTVQPLMGTPNSVSLTGNLLSDNGGNGALFRTQGDAYLLGNAVTNVVENNFFHGLMVETSENSAFGDPENPAMDPVGTRSLFDGNTIRFNQRNGIELQAIDRSRILVDVASDTADTLITNNGTLDTLDVADLNDILDHPDPAEVQSLNSMGRNGIRFSTNGGRSNVLIRSGTNFSTLIAENGNTSIGGNGIQINARNTIPDGLGLINIEQSTVTVQETTLRDNINSTTGNALDDVHGDGIQITALEDASPLVVVGGDPNLNLGNVIQSNDGDGISINVADRANPSVTIQGNLIGGNGVDANNNPLGNGNHGINIRTDLRESAFSNQANVGEGATPVVRMLTNEITRNAGRGVSIYLRGVLGTRDRLSAVPTYVPAEFRLEQGNVISSNGLEGLYYEANPGRVTNTTLIFNSFNTDGVPYTGAQLAPIYAAANAGTLANQSQVLNGSLLNPPRSAYLNLDVEQISQLVVTDNTIQNNGLGALNGGPSSDGVLIRVANNSYVAADVEGNTFGGNAGSDFRTDAFITTDDAGNQILPALSVDNTNASGLPDMLVLDDSAQFDLRFNRNINGDSGVSVDLSQAFYVDPSALGDDPLKVDGQRLVHLFQVDGPEAPFADLSAPNNQFTLFGSPQDVDGVFNFGGYNLRANPDPNFPNILFPPFLP